MHSGTRLILFLLSFLIVAFGQEDFIPALAPLAAICGFALFWKALLSYPAWKQRFWISFGWFFVVQLVKLSWMTNIEYVGAGLLAVYTLFALVLGLQFGLTSLLVRFGMRLWEIVAVAGVWTLWEYSRLFFLTGYTWNPVGLSLASFLPTLQIAAFVGIYGLSFVVIFLNLLFLQGKWKMAFASIVSLLVVGFAHLMYQEKQEKSSRLETLLVQTALMQGGSLAVGPPLPQWNQILSLTAPYRHTTPDLIVLPEGTVPHWAYYPLYSYLDVVNLFRFHFGQEGLLSLPTLQSPVAHWHNGVWFVSNAYIAQALANFFQAELIAGFESGPDEEGSYYQSMFHFQPGFERQMRYDKRCLVPIGEYFPFEWCQKVAESCGITGAFTAGSQARLLGRKAILGPCICYEETNCRMMRENKGCDCLVNITNDGWYPGQALPKQHLAHARLRTVELGVPLIRACTTGVTAVVDSLGRTVASLPCEEPGALCASVPLFGYPTLYARFGDLPVVIFSFLFLPFLLMKIKNRRMI